MILAFWLLLAALHIAAFWQIWYKAGYHGAWSLLMLVPFVNLAALLWLAFSDWPVHRVLRRMDDFD